MITTRRAGLIWWYLRKKRRGILHALQTTLDYFATWGEQETSGTVAGADNIAVPLGRDLVTEGTFPNDPGVWTLGANWSIAGGKALYDDLASTSINQVLPLQGGRTYTITFDIADLAAGVAKLAFANSAGSAIYVATTDYTNGSHVENFTAPSTETTFAIFGNAGSTGTFSITNVVCQQTDILPSSAYPGPELYVTPNAASDPAGNEADATTGWAVAGGTTLTSDSTVKEVGDYSIKGTFAATGNSFYFDLDTILTVGKRYSLAFGTRHLGSGGECSANLATGVNGADTQLVLLDNTDTTFQSIIKEFTHSAATRYFNARELSLTDDGGVYVDNISITERNPLDADHSGVAVGQPGQYNVPIVASYGGVDEYTDRTSAERNSVYNAAEDFDTQILFRKTTWDATERYIIDDYVDADNWVRVYGTSTLNQIAAEIRAGGVTEQVLWDSAGSTDLTLIDLGRESDVFKVRINAVLIGSEAIAGAFVGNFQTMYIGARQDLTRFHLGDAAYAGDFSGYVSDAEMARIRNSMGIA